MVTRVYKREGNIVTVTGYDEKFVEFARSKKAKWNKYKKSWNFNESLEQEVLEKVKEIYGEFVNTVYGWDNKEEIYFDLINNPNLEITFNLLDEELKEIFRTTDFRFVKRNDEIILFFNSLGIENADDRKYLDYVGLDSTGYTVDFEKQILQIKENAKLVIFKKLYEK